MVGFGGLGGRVSMKRRRFGFPVRCLSVSLLLSLSSFGLPVVAHGQESQPSGDSPDEAQPVRRSATSNTYRNDNGSFTTKLFNQPVNYRTRDGEWRPIDSEIVASNSRVPVAEQGQQLRHPVQGPPGRGLPADRRQLPVLSPHARGGNTGSDRPPSRRPAAEPDADCGSY
jgi:hypothetical protein